MAGETGMTGATVEVTMIVGEGVTTTGGGAGARFTAGAAAVVRRGGGNATSVTPFGPKSVHDCLLYLTAVSPPLRIS